MILVAPRAHHLVPAEGQGQFRQIAVVQYGDANGEEVVQQPGEKLIEDLGAPSQQAVHVSTLRNAPTVNRVIGESVPFHHGDGVVTVRQRPRGQ